MPEALELLSERPSLISVSLQFYCDHSASLGLEPVYGEFYLPQWTLHGHRFADVPKAMASFRNLVRLDLLELWGEVDHWKDYMLRILCQSPQLQHLALSLSEACRHRERGRDNWPWGALLSEVCIRYGKVSEGGLLALKVLHMGVGIRCPDLDEIQNLTDVRLLQDLAIFIEYVTFHGQLVQKLTDGTRLLSYNDLFEFSFGWELLSPEVTKSLRILSFCCLDDNLWENLGPLCTDSWPVCLRFAQLGKLDDYTPYDILREHQDSYITGLVLPPPERDINDVETALQSLQGHHSLTRLGLQLIKRSFSDDEGAPSVSSVCVLLKSLPSLSALWLYSRVEPERCAFERYTAAVSKLAAAGESLKYIRIEDISWHVDRTRSSPTIAHLDPSSDRESCPELFQFPFPSAWFPHFCARKDNWMD